jgi:CBS domain-containing protein
MTNASVLTCDDMPTATPFTPGNIATGDDRSRPTPVTDAVFVRPDEPIARAVRLIARGRLGAVAVVNARGELVGLVRDRDLLTRLTSRRRSWWATLCAGNRDLIREYRTVTGATVGDVMGPPPVPVSAGATIEAAADLLLRQRLRELPVVAEGRVVGMVTRSSVLGLLERAEPPAADATDADLVREMRDRLCREPWVTNRALWVEATRGVLFIAGLVESEDERAALEIMARTIPGCRGVDNQTFPRSAVRAPLV